MTGRWLSEEEQRREASELPAGCFVLDGQASLQAVVGRIADESDADGIGLVAVLDDGEKP
jgi:hypothetical protein